MSIKFVDPNALALLSALFAIDLAQGLDLEEQNVAGNFIIDVGQILLTMAAAQEAQLKAKEEKEKEEKEEEEKEKEEKGKEKKGKETETKQKPVSEAKSKEEKDQQSGGKSDVPDDEDEFIGREREGLQRRIESLERQVRQLAAAVEGKR